MGTATGIIAKPNRTVTAATTVVGNEVIFADASSGALPVTGPAAGSARRWGVKKIDTSANAVTINYINAAGNAATISLGVADDAKTFEPVGSGYGAVNADRSRTQDDRRYASGPSALEGVTLYAYGHSYNASDAYNSGAGAAGRWVSRIADRARMTLVTRATNGITMETNARNALLGSFAWVPNARGLVTLCCTVNNVTAQGNSAAAVRGYKRAARAFFAAVRAKLQVPSTSAACVYSSGWTNSTTTPTIGTSRWTTSTAGSTVSFKVTGDATDLFLTMRAAGTGVVAITVDGASKGSIDLSETVASDYTATAYALTGMGTGTHTVVLTLSSGAILFDGFSIPSETPPPVLALGEGPVLNYGGADVATYNGYLVNTWLPALASVAAEFGNVTYTTVDSGWDTSTMLRTDAVVSGTDQLIHPNDRGAAYLATLALALLRLLGWNNGMNALGTLPTYITPTPPTIQSGGNDGTGATSSPTVSDSFNRADSSTSLGSTDTNQAWAALSGTFGISSNQAYKSAASSGTEDHAVLESSRSDVDISVTLTAMAAATGFGPTFRATDVNNLWTVDCSTSGIVLYKRVSGTYNSVQTLTATACAAGDLIRVVPSGSTIKVYKNGTQVGTTVTDSFNSTATKHGIRFAGSVPAYARLDNFSIA